jgi:diguanylate cyclase (GGDEF)-like protein
LATLRTETLFFNQTYAIITNMTKSASAPAENPQFAIANQMMANYISALGIAQKIQEEGDKRNAELAEMAKIDPVSGLYNRRALEEAYSGLKDTKKRRVSDPDQAEHYNGHGEGDRVIRQVADTMKANIRKRDLAVRLGGGDEFGILLPRCNTERAMEIAQAVRLGVKWQGDVTLSIGVTGISLYETLEESLQEADAAMYTAKKQGRNQVFLFDEHEIDPLSSPPIAHA